MYATPTQIKGIPPTPPCQGGKKKQTKTPLSAAGFAFLYPPDKGG